MTKKDVRVVSPKREKNIEVAQDTLKIIKNKYYIYSNNSVDISDDLDYSIKNSIIYKDDIPSKEYINLNPTIEVVNETTTSAAIRLLNTRQNIVALNFASAINPGGGFLSGASAQEEDLARCSGLYACLKNKPLYYNANIINDNSLYTDGIIYSPDVPFFKDDEYKYLEKPYKLSIISAPAPNINGLKSVDQTVLNNTLVNRIKKILQIAELYNHKTLILGAWGCGAFGNDADMVANIFLDAIKSIPCFEHICFAVFDNRENQPVYNTFKSIFGG